MCNLVAVRTVPGFLTVLRLPCFDGETLEVCAGLWPDRDPALRAAIDDPLTREADPAARPD